MSNWFQPSDATKARERRNEEARAKRGTEEWREAGAQLVKEREEARAREEARRSDPFAGTEDEWELATWDISPRMLDRTTRRFDATLKEASEDSGQEPDVIAMDMLDAFLFCDVFAKGLTKRTIAMALELLRTQFAMPVGEALDHLRRIAR